MIASIWNFYTNSFLVQTSSKSRKSLRTANDLRKERWFFKHMTNKALCWISFQFVLESELNFKRVQNVLTISSSNKSGFQTYFECYSGVKQLMYQVASKQPKKKVQSSILDLKCGKIKNTIFFRQRFSWIIPINSVIALNNSLGTEVKAAFAARLIEGCEKQNM